MLDLFFLPYITAIILLIVIALIFFTRDIPMAWPPIFFAVICVVIIPLALISYKAEATTREWIRSHDDMSSLSTSAF